MFDDSLDPSSFKPASAGRYSWNVNCMLCEYAKYLLYLQMNGAVIEIENVEVRLPVEI